MKKIILFFGFIVLTFSPLYAKEAVILYTGQTHAMLYPCSCLVEIDGGVSRRSTLVKELRKKHPALLLLDCGNFTAGGLMDEYTQNTKLDMQRSEANLKAMELMRYDAACVGPDEFNFGKDFFLRKAKKSNPAFLSANLDSNKVLPHIIKESGGIKIGIIGLTDLEAGQKSEGLRVGPPQAIGGLVAKLRKQGVEVVVVLSTLGEQENLKLISQVKGIDILFAGHNPSREQTQDKLDSTFIVRPSWQGRRLGKLTLQVEGGRLLSCKIEEERLSDKIRDDPAIKAILPACYSDVNCKKEGMVAACRNPGELRAECIFTKPDKVSLLVINTKDCSVCQAEPALGLLKREFPGIAAEHLYLPDPAAQKLVNEFKIQALPAYLLGKEVEKEKNFDKMKDSLELKADFYMLKPQLSGIAYFINRKPKKGGFDLFLSLFDNDTPRLLEAMKEFKPELHFLAVEKEGSFDAKSGGVEAEEYLRSVCVRKYYPQKFWDYLICRTKDIKSSWWDECLGQANTAKVRACARGQEGAKLLKENTALNKELQVMFGPTYLLENREIFSSRGVPGKEEFKKLIKK